MFKIKKRSREAEILDNFQLDRHDLRENLRELAKVNRLLGGHSAVIKSLKSIICSQPEKVWRIADMGSGGGDTLQALHEWAVPQSIEMKLSGYDANDQALAFASSEQNANLRFKKANLLKPWQIEAQDIIMFNLFLHHFSDEEIAFLLKQAARHGKFIVINDLQRNWLPYHLFRLVSRIFRFSAISRHDGKLSVKKSFTKADWQSLFRELNFKNYKITWHWAFRWVACVDLRKEEEKAAI